MSIACSTFFEVGLVQWTYHPPSHHHSLPSHCQSVAEHMHRSQFGSSPWHSKVESMSTYSSNSEEVIPSGHSAPFSTTFEGNCPKPALAEQLEIDDSFTSCHATLSMCFACSSDVLHASCLATIQAPESACVTIRETMLFLHV